MSEVETKVGLFSPEERREEKLLLQHEKIKRLSPHPYIPSLKLPLRTDLRDNIQTT